MPFTRSRFLQTSTLALPVVSASFVFGQAPAVVTSETSRPQILSGVQSGDIATDRAIVWSRSDRLTRMWIEWSTTASFRGTHRVRGPYAIRRRPLQPQVQLPDGTLWHKLVTEEKATVAESLNDFRGNFRYNLLDANVRRFNSEIAQIWQWDDHEVVNNYSVSQDLSKDPRYREKSIALFATRGQRTFLEYAAMRRRRSRSRLSADLLWSAARSVRRRHAVLPRTEQLQPADGDQQRIGLPRPGAGRLAHPGIRAIHGRVEGDRGRHDGLAQGLEQRRALVGRSGAGIRVDPLLRCTGPNRTPASLHSP